jgi:hypothetical protein
MDGGMTEVMDILRAGQARKHFATTAMNERSSRSHTAFIVQVCSYDSCQTMNSLYLREKDVNNSIKSGE